MSIRHTGICINIYFGYKMARLMMKKRIDYCIKNANLCDA